MNRTKIILPIALLLLLALALLRPPKADPHAPKFVPAASQPTGSFLMERYLGSYNPFQGGKVWILAASTRTNFHYLLYDLDKRIVLGELFKAAPVFANQDQTRLLCYGYRVSFKDRVVQLLNKISMGRIATKPVETYWILDLRNNSAVRVGELSQSMGQWWPSPGLRYGFNVPNTDDPIVFFLTDLEAGKFERVKFDGRPKGWWDDHSILIEDSKGNYILLDVVTRKTSTLFSAEAIARNLKELGISHNPTNLCTIFNWNGRDYDLYFTGKPLTGNQALDFDWNIYTNRSFLIKADRAGPTLKLLYRDLKFEFAGRLDATATHYLYGGENWAPGAGGNRSVILRDLANNTERVIVPPDNSGLYSLPRFYGDSVIYSRNRVLWRIDLNGTNATRLLPPPGHQKPEK
jgi:hypothetical protein